MEDLTGQRFNKLVVIGIVPINERKYSPNRYRCRCDCGNTVDTSGHKLKSGHTKSCGCMKTERIGQLNRKYKETNKHLYGVYKAMVNRCVNEKDPAYHNYGGRGIKVCEEWLNDYDKFAEWALSSGYVLDAPQGLYTLDRKDNNKDYSPDNCRWVTIQEQQNNKRTCRFFEYGGETHSIADWARKWGYDYKYLYHRLIDRQLPIELFAR